MIDDLIQSFDRGLRTLAGVAATARGVPGADLADAPLADAERRHAAGLMRVNHTGEVCAQALYAAQALVARDASIRDRFAQAAREEEEHLAWTQARLDDLGSRPSLLNPLWFTGAFAIGVAAGLAGDARESRLRRRDRAAGRGTPVRPHGPASPGDQRSRAIVEQMRDDEARHGAMALAAGAAPLPFPVPFLMRRAADVMRAVAYRL